MEEVEQTKWIASLVLFIITLLCGYLPVKFILNQNYVQHAMFAGGGVLMATAFCHLIPEAHDNFKLASGAGGAPVVHLHSHNHNSQPPPTTTTTATQPLLVSNDSTSNNISQLLQNTTTTTTNPTALLINATNNNSMINLTATANAADSQFFFESSFIDSLMAQLSNINVPYLEMTLCCGFFFMLIVEQLMLKFINNHTHEHPCDAASDSSSQCGGQMAAVVCHLTPLPDSSELGGGGGGTTGSLVTNGTTTMGSSVGNLSTTAINPTSLARGGGGGDANQMMSNSTSGNLSPATEFYKFLRGLLIVSAFGAHSIFDGVAIGSQETVDKVWTIFIAISCHKLIIAAVVGLELYAATLESNLWTLVHLTIFSIMSPIGIILVVVAQNSLHINSDHPGMILLQSFATGTLLYIIFVEILHSKEGQSHEKSRLGKSFSLMAGFALMLLVLTLVGEGE